MGFEEKPNSIFKQEDMPLIWITSIVLLTIITVTVVISASCLLETYLEFKMANEAGLEQKYVEGRNYPIWVSK